MYAHASDNSLITGMSALEIHNSLCAWQIVMKENRIQNSLKLTAIFDLPAWQLIHTDNAIK